MSSKSALNFFTGMHAVHYFSRTTWRMSDRNYFNSIMWMFVYINSYFYVSLRMWHFWPQSCQARKSFNAKIIGCFEVPDNKIENIAPEGLSAIKPIVLAKVWKIYLISVKVIQFSVLGTLLSVNNIFFYVTFLQIFFFFL